MKKYIFTHKPVRPKHVVYWWCYLSVKYIFFHSCVLTIFYFILNYCCTQRRCPNLKLFSYIQHQDKHPYFSVPLTVLRAWTVQRVQGLGSSWAERGMNGSRWHFSTHIQSISALGPIQPPVEWVLWLIPGDKAGTWGWSLTSLYAKVEQERSCTLWRGKENFTPVRLIRLRKKFFESSL
jgi:hypothetical protein